MVSVPKVVHSYRIEPSAARKANQETGKGYTPDSSRIIIQGNTGCTSIRPYTLPSTLRMELCTCFS
ncbi:hypothetical protein HMPREF1990_00596 [Porphyromonas gingivalis W4087]|nr:hypothetical protein HMPREF1990_00596 [Porphyromonas gingivalis W4087]